MSHFFQTRLLLGPLFAVLLWTFATTFAQAQAAKFFNDSGMDEGNPVPHPWSGAGKNGLQMQTGTNSGVDEQGRARNFRITPAVRLGDVNRDGLVDIVGIDGAGVVWFFQNVGDAKKPLFLNGEALPLRPFFEDNLRHVGGMNFDLVDIDGDNAPDLIIGDMFGRLFPVRNEGAPNRLFVQPADLERNQWKLGNSPEPAYNYIAPTYVDWNGDGRRDLIFGDGTYAANNIFLALNQGSNQNPRFDTVTMLIPGLGKQMICPVAVDWNGDGKLDLLVGDRTGDLTLYLNTTPSPTAATTFAPPQKVSLGNFKVNEHARPAVGDLNGDGLFDIAITQNDAAIFIAFNTGTKEAPKFGAPVPAPVKFDEKFDLAREIISPRHWNLFPIPQTRFMTLSLVSDDPKDKAFDKTFVRAPGSKSPRALRMNYQRPANLKFDATFTPRKLSSASSKNDDDDVELLSKHVVSAPQTSRQQTKFPVDKPQRLTFMYKHSGFRTADILVRCTGEGDAGRVDIPLRAAPDWTKFDQPVRLQTRNGKAKEVSVNILFLFEGEGNFQLDDIAFGN